ncbi:MAG TPA: hypothetical protein VFV54_07350 [Thermoanaerobaculia bacterium]|nr:hypothetical protein [Thermoanaerobaculia bacterium]
MKIAILTLLLALALPQPSAALDTNELLSLVAMPLAVAAVSEITDVPTRDLVNLVSALNRAEVPPTRFVEVVRYAPVAIVDTTYDPPFVSYVDTRVNDGLVGDALVLDIQERYRPYGVEQFDYTAPRLLVVDDAPVLPPLVTNRFGLDPLALVAMPLAVAAVAELTDVPMNDLVSLLMAMNRADVPPTQFVELVRYSPVVLLDDANRPAFIRYVTTDMRDLQRDAYALALAQQLRNYGADDLDVVRVSDTVYVTDREYLPAVVRNHPHGGPPGQLKKELGLQTGAEVVHGSKPGRRDDDRLPARVVDRTVDRDRDDDDRGSRGRGAVRVDKPKSQGESRGSSARRADPGPPTQLETPGRGRGNASGADKPKENQGGGKPDKGNSGKGKGKG